MTRQLNTILFDLDGTLADTAPDLADTLNVLLAEKQRPPLPYDTIRPHVSHGATALVRLGFGMEPDEAEFEPLRQRFLDLYEQRLAKRTCLFPGMENVLDALEQGDCRWGVVTNKPARFTVPLLTALGLEKRAACIISGDSTRQRKPHPEPLQAACRSLGATALQCVYIGDARRDIEAGRRAGIMTLVALFGYLGEQDRPEQWQADGMVRSPADILDWLDEQNRRNAS